MQKLLEKKNKKKEKERRRGGRAPGLPLGFGPSQQAGPPHQPGRPSSPKRAPFLFPWCAPLQGRRPRRTTSPSTRRIRSTPPLDASASSPATPTHLRLSHSPPDSPSSTPLSRTRARSPPRLDCPRGHRAPFASPSSPSSPPPSSTQSPSVSASREPLRGADRAAPFLLCRR